MSFNIMQKKNENDKEKKDTGQSMYFQKGSKNKRTGLFTKLKVMNFARKTKNKKNLSKEGFERITEEYKNLKTEISGNKELESRLDLIYGSFSQSFIGSTNNKINDFQVQTIKRKNLSKEGFERITEEYQKLKDELSWNKDLASGLDTTYGSYAENYNEAQTPVSQKIYSRLNGLDSANLIEQEGVSKKNGELLVAVLNRDKNALDWMDFKGEEKQQLVENYVGLFSGEQKEENAEEKQFDSVKGLFSLFWERNKRNIQGLLKRDKLPEEHWLSEYFPDLHMCMQFFTCQNVQGLFGARGKKDEEKCYDLLSDLAVVCGQEYEIKERLKNEKIGKEHKETNVFTFLQIQDMYWSKIKNKYKDFNFLGDSNKGTWKVLKKIERSPKNDVWPYVKNMKEQGENSMKEKYERLYEKD